MPFPSLLFLSSLQHHFFFLTCFIYICLFFSPQPHQHLRICISFLRYLLHLPLLSDMVFFLLSKPSLVATEFLHYHFLLSLFALCDLSCCFSSHPLFDANLLKMLAILHLDIFSCTFPASFLLFLSPSPGFTSSKLKEEGSSISGGTLEKTSDAPGLPNPIFQPPPLPVSQSCYLHVCV